ncbi:MAG: hypothetical protein HC813_00555 [Planctomycetes bacterium]|nr:hypothetical protein [Planctomycetota bacterium]
MASKSTQALQEEKVQLELTPMIDVSFLILIFFMCLPFKTLEGKLLAFLPTDKGIAPIPQEPPNEIMVSVHIMARAEEPRTWGPGGQITVKMPTKVVYKFGDRETEDLARVGAWIADAKRAAGAGGGSNSAVVKGEIKAGHKTPHKFVVAVLNKFTEAGLEKVDFYGTAIPTPELRKLKILPYPAKNYLTSD